MSKHYDVVVLGAGIGALSAAALLARRSWRVLVLGQGFRPAQYTFDGFALARRAFSFLAGSSPAWRRVTSELAQSQAFRRHLSPLDPPVQILDARRRFSMSPEASRFGREVDREFREVRRVVDDLYADLARARTVTDAAFDLDLVWPPGTFWERRENARATATLPFARGSHRDLLAEFPREHPYRGVVDISARFASDLATNLPAAGVARLHAAWAGGVEVLQRGEADLVDFLVERIRAHGGDVALGGRATRIESRGGRVSGVRLDGDEDATGVQFAVTDLPSHALLDLATEHRPSRGSLDARPTITQGALRFVTSFVVRKEAIPVPLAREVFLIPEPGTLRPALHVQVHPAAGGPEGTMLLMAEALVDADIASRPDELGRLRATVAATLESFLPFVERHYVVVDSPHDGLPVWDYRAGRRAGVDRAETRAGGGSREAEPMLSQVSVEGPGVATVDLFMGEPLRYPLDGVFGVGRSVLPVLGQEGELLAAWSAARIITRTDRRKEKMRREMWRKVELS